MATHQARAALGVGVDALGLLEELIDVAIVVTLNQSLLVPVKVVQQVSCGLWRDLEDVVDLFDGTDLGLRANGSGLSRQGAARGEDGDQLPRTGISCHGR